MAYWYYYDSVGRKQGPYSGGQLRQLAKLGTILPETMIETAEGKTAPAKEVDGLSFFEPKQFETTQSGPSPLPPIIENPFTAAMPEVENPFTAPEPENPFTAPMPKTKREKPQSIPVPFPEKNGKRSKTTFIIAGVLILLLLGGTAWPILSESEKLDAVSRKLIEESFDGKPLQITDLSVNWATKPTISDVIKSFWRSMFGFENNVILVASGKIIVRANVSENLYEFVSYKVGLQELRITDTHEDQFNIAVENIRNLPEEYRRHVRVPDLEDPSLFRFYRVHVPEGENVTLSGNIELTQENMKWREVGIQVDPVSNVDYTPVSRLQRDAHKLDDPETKIFIKTIIDARKKFIDRVNVAYDDWTFKETWTEGLRKTVVDKPFEIINMSVDWKDKTVSPVSGKFTMKVVTTEKLYRPVDKKAALEKLGTAKQYGKIVEELGITKFFDDEISDGNLLKHFDFHEVFLPNGSEVSLTGNIKLSKADHGPWQLDGIPDVSIVPALDGLVWESRMQGIHKLDDPRTKETLEVTVQEFVNWLAALIKQKDDFDKYCKPGMRYTGQLSTSVHNCDVNIDFKDAPNTTTIKGTITIIPPDSRAKLVRSFSVNADFLDALEITDYPVTGVISNANLPSLITFRNRLKPFDPGQEERITHFWNVMNQNTILRIRFDKKIQFSIHRRPDFGRDNVPRDILFDMSYAYTNDKVPSNPDRSWIVPAIKKRTSEKTASTRIPEVEPMIGTPQKSERMKRSVGDLEPNEAIRKNGLKNHRILP